MNALSISSTVWVSRVWAEVSAGSPWW